MSSKNIFPTNSKDKWITDTWHMNVIQEYIKSVVPVRLNNPSRMVGETIMI